GGARVVERRHPGRVRAPPEHRRGDPGRQRRRGRVTTGALGYPRPRGAAGGGGAAPADPRAAYLADGTTLVDLLLKDAVIEPGRLIDIGRLPLRGISICGDALMVGALTTMAGWPTTRPYVRGCRWSGRRCWRG